MQILKLGQNAKTAAWDKSRTTETYVPVVTQLKYALCDPVYVRPFQAK